MDGSTKAVILATKLKNLGLHIGALHNQLWGKSEQLKTKHDITGHIYIVGNV